MNIRCGVWPATGLAPGLLDVQNFVGNNFLNRFPKGFIQTYHFDSKTGFRTDYKNTRKKAFNNKFRGQFSKQDQPRLTIIFNNSDGKQEDAAGGIEDPFTYPLVQGIHHEMHGYIPFYRDKNGIELWYVPKRVKYTFSAIVEVDTESDQESVLSICENVFKVQYGAMLEKFKADYLLPNEMINTIYKVKYYDQIQRIRSDVDGDNDEKNEALFKLGDEFEKELTEGSKGGIIRYSRNGKRDDKFFSYRMIYEKMYFQLSDYPQKTDGEKLGSMYSKFTVTFDGFFEFFRPNAYILKIPEVVNGHILTDIFENTGDINYFRDYNPTSFMKFFNRNKRIPLKVQQLMTPKFGNYSIIYKETDLTLEDGHDSIDIVDWMASDKILERQKYGALIATMDKEEFDKSFIVIIYNITDDTLIDPKNINFDGEVIQIKNTNSYSQYSIYVLAKVYNLENKLNELMSKVEDCKNECNRSNWE